MKFFNFIIFNGLVFFLNPVYAMPDHPACPDESYFTVRGDDGINYGWFQDATCIVESVNSNTSGFPACPDASYDSDGDRYGWYNSATCYVLAEDINPDMTPDLELDVNRHPYCPDASYATVRGMDGILYGWFEDASCIVDESDAEGGSTDGVTTDDSDTDAESTDGGDTDGGSTDGGSTDGGTTDDNDTDAESTDGSDTDGGTMEGGTSDGGTTVGDSAGGDSIDAGNTDGGTTDGGADGGDTARVSTLAPITQYPDDTCLTLQDTRDGNYHGPILLGDFILSTNAWNFGAAGNYAWEQCIFANTNGELAGWSYDWGAGGGTTDYLVRSYPELIYGVKSQGEISAPKSVTGLPSRVDELPTITIDYSYTSEQNGPARPVEFPVNDRYQAGDLITGERNIAVESFFHPAAADGSCPESVVQRSSGASNHTYELMVWLDSGAERLPSGPGDEVTTATIEGVEYRVFTKSSDEKYVAFVAVNPQQSGTIVWTSFIDWAQTHAHRVVEDFGANTNSVMLQDDWCLGNILVGTEIFWGAGNFDLFDWTIRQAR